MAVEVRAARAEDEAGCMALLEALIGRPCSDAWRSAYRRLRDVHRSAREGGALLGVATVSYNLAIRYGGEYAQLEELIVSAEARGKNAGGLLVQAAVSAARDRGCAEMGLYLLPSTEGNRPFYAKYGFAYVGSELRQPISSRS